MTEVDIFDGYSRAEIAALVLQMRDEMEWIVSQRHLRPDEQHDLMQGLWRMASRHQRRAIVEVLMLKYCNLFLPLRSIDPSTEKKT
jgi:hypothetical protein